MEVWKGWWKSVDINSMLGDLEIELDSEEEYPYETKGMIEFKGRYLKGGRYQLKLVVEEHIIRGGFLGSGILLEIMEHGDNFYRGEYSTQNPDTKGRFYLHFSPETKISYVEKDARSYVLF